MHLTSKKNIRSLLKKHKIYPLKGLGQNFLIAKRVIKKIVKAANLQQKDIILEIGPGVGNLTQELAKKVKKVIAVEKDQRMCQILKETLKDYKNVEIVNKDILKFPMNNEQRTANNKKLFIVRCPLSANYKVVANLPYYITSPVIRKFLELENPPEEMVLTVQKEVAQRICAAPRTRTSSVRGRPPKMSILAVSVQFYASTKIISYVSKKSFWPTPKVDSAIIQIIPRSSAYGSASFREQFFRIVKTGFSQPRKQLANNLAKKLKLNKEQVNKWLLKNKIQPSQRAETLGINSWVNLTKSLK